MGHASIKFAQLMRFCPRCGNRYDHELYCPEDGVATEALPNAPSSSDALIGKVVEGRYRVEQQIGEGGMGVVYRATHVSLNKPLALKVLRGEMAKDAEVVQRFIQEAQAATSIGHENIIDISDFGKLDDGTVYFVMEYLNGQPLNDLIKRGGSIPVKDAVSIIRQIGDALGAAHQRGIVHRDLKPDNVYLISRGEGAKNFVKVLDFGIAKVGGASNKLTRTGMVFGTPHYMSPEQAAGQSVDNRTDIYALGVIMYEMFTGRVPFDADTFMGVLTKHMFEKPEPMNKQGAERQLGALEDITMRALEKKPENRYQTMADLIEDLGRVLGGGRPELRGSQPQAASAALADALEPRSRSEMRLEAQLGGNTVEIPGHKSATKLLWIALGAGAVVAIGALAVWGTSRGEETRAKAPALPAAPVMPPPALPEAPPTAKEPTGGKATELLAVLVESEPTGATVVMDGAIVGQTPARFPRPESGERSIELRLEGYGKETVRLTSTSPSQLHVALKKRAVTTTRAPKPTPVASPASSSTNSNNSKATKKRKVSEVVDPWAN